MQTFLSNRFQALNVFILLLVIIIALFIQKILSNIQNLDNHFIPFIVILTSFISYGALIQFFYMAMKRSRFLKLYWGKLYLHGFWYYKYTIEGNLSNKEYFGIWKFEQDLYGTKITGYGYSDDFKIRTMLTSVTQIIDNNNKFEVTNLKIDASCPDVEFYSKTSMSFMANPQKSFFNPHPVKFNAFTSIYGGNFSGKIHLDSFTKVEHARSEDCVLEILKEQFNYNERKKTNNKTARNNKPFAIIVMGRTASGKTTTAYCIAKKLKAEHIPFAYYKRLVKPNYTKEDSLNENLRDLGFNLAIKKSIEILQNNKSVIIDSSLGKKQRRKIVIDSLAPYVDAFYIVYCLSSNLDETKQRLSARKGREHESIQYHASDYDVFTHIDKTFEEPKFAELDVIKGSKYLFLIDTFKKEIINDTNKSSGLLTQKINNYLRECISSSPQIPPILINEKIQ